MESFPPFVMSNQQREFVEIRVNEGFNSICYRVVGMENIKKGRARREMKLVSESIDSSHRYEHTYKERKHLFIVLAQPLTNISFIQFVTYQLENQEQRGPSVQTPKQDS
jgi:hypothetical protein